MDFKTHISAQTGNGHSIYGHRVVELMQQASFTEVIYLLYAGRMPSAGERVLLDAMLVAAAEHGIEAPSLYVPRISAASGNSVHVAMAAGILALGERHGGAGEMAAQLLASKDSPQSIVSVYTEKDERIPGYGHPLYKEEDPRATLLFQTAKNNALPLEFFEKAYAIETALAEAKGKKLPLNIDGAFAAGVLALGLMPMCAKAFFVIARTAGMGAHAIEEIEQKNTYKRLI